MQPASSDPSLPDKAADTLGRRPLAGCCADGGNPGIDPQARRGGGIPAVSAVLLAFFASQHHSIMMALFAFGLSDAAMSFMTAAPMVRDAMLGMSFMMIGVVAWQIRDSRRPPSMRVMGALSIAATLGLSAWSIAHFGL